MAYKDRYYTPESIALQLVDALDYRSVSNCVDPNCGSGRLLFSAESRWPDARFSGLDIDRRAIQRIRKDRPRWIVSVGNLLSSSSISKTYVFQTFRSCDILLLNPPFSMGNSKKFFVDGNAQRISVAMAHIMRAIRLFRPKMGIGAIVPESLLYSELDEHNRDNLYKYWEIDMIKNVPHNTFKGTDVHACIITLQPRDRTLIPIASQTMPNKIGIGVNIVRGNLPVHRAKFVNNGIFGFIHSTDLKTLNSSIDVATLNIPSLHQGCILGSVILIPRVGVPSFDQIGSYNFTKPVQLSDCVIALCFSTSELALKAASIIRREHDSLVSLYKGTGARYITIKRIAKWLLNLGFEVSY